MQDLAPCVSKHLVTFADCTKVTPWLGSPCWDRQRLAQTKSSNTASSLARVGHW